MEQLPRTLRTSGALGTPTIIRRLHNEVPNGFQGSFGGYYAFSPRCPPRRILTTDFGPPSVNTPLGEPLNIFAFASLGRGAAARYSYAMNTSLFDQEHAASPDDVVPCSEVKDSALARIRR